MTGIHFKDHFSVDAGGYAAYRPSYPAELVDELAVISPSLMRALDCGCGSGQLSELLAGRFDEVIATDASAAQIAKARPRHGVIYRTAAAEDSGLPDACVDLITVAQAAHWLNLEKFYTEVRRVAKPQAVVALITYGILHVEGAVDDVVQHFYHDTIASYWPPERRHVEDGYRRLPFPFDEVVLPPLAIEVQWHLGDLIGYFNTWSAVKTAERILGFNPVNPFAEILRRAWGDTALRRRVTWPLSVRAGHVRI